MKELQLFYHYEIISFQNVFRKKSWAHKSGFVNLKSKWTFAYITTFYYYYYEIKYFLPDLNLQFEWKLSLYLLFRFHWSIRRKWSKNQPWTKSWKSVCNESRIEFPGFFFQHSFYFLPKNVSLEFSRQNLFCLNC